MDKLYMDGIRPGDMGIEFTHALTQNPHPTQTHDFDFDCMSCIIWHRNHSFD